MSSSRIVLAVFLLATLFFFAKVDLCAQVPEVGPPKCAAESTDGGRTWHGCGAGRNTNTYTNTNTGPSPEELKKQREAKDTQEATDDAEDRGEDYYKKGDWADAVKAFQEALDYDPDNAIAQTNLQKAQQRLTESLAAHQAVNAQTSSTNAAATNLENSSALARKTFDSPDNTKNNGIVVPAVSGGEGHKDPVVPPGRRTPAILKLEQQRTKDRKDRAALQQKLKTLDPQKDVVAISKIKQQESTLDNHVNFLNFSIGEQLKTPSQVPAANK